MKLRLGFVSNSSSSSFCVYGADIEKFIPDLLGNKVFSNSYERNNYIESLFKGTGFEFHNSDGEFFYGVIVGKSPYSMKDDETFGQFKNDIKTKISEIVGKEVDCGVFEAGWYDG